MNLAGVFGGALPPLIAGTLLATYGSWAIGLMLAILALASLVCTYLLPGNQWNNASIRSGRCFRGRSAGSPRQRPVAQLACRSSLRVMP